MDPLIEKWAVLFKFSFLACHFLQAFADALHYFFDMCVLLPTLQVFILLRAACRNKMDPIYRVTFRKNIVYSNYTGLERQWIDNYLVSDQRAEDMQLKNGQNRIIFTSRTAARSFAFRCYCSWEEVFFIFFQSFLFTFLTPSINLPKMA